MPITFNRVGFPVRVETVADTRQLTDCMQEGRFDSYMAELGGLDATDLALLVGALVDWARWFCKTYHTRTCRLPFDTMMAHLALYTKLRDFPASSTILEIGPGCGYLAFYLRQQAPLLRYVQAEVTESFYILQASVNDWCFANVEELAAIDAPDAGDDDLATAVAPIGPACMHVPWWRLGSVYETFDLITANACLNEMSPQAFADYVGIISRSLSPTGALVMQCPGGGALPTKKLMDDFAAAGLKMAFAANLGRHGTKSFAASTVVWNRGGECDLPPGLFAVSAGRRVYSAHEIAGLVSDRLSETTA